MPARAAKHPDDMSPEAILARAAKARGDVFPEWKLVALRLDAVHAHMVLDAPVPGSLRV